MNSILIFVFLIIIPPLLNFILLSFSGKKLKNKAGLISITLLGISLIFSAYLVVSVWLHGTLQIQVPWIQTNYLDFPAGIFIDRVSGIMLFLVCFISLMVYIFSLDYMKNEE